MMGAGEKLVVSLFFLIFSVVAAKDALAIADYDSETVTILPDGSKTKAIKGNPKRLKYRRRLTGTGEGGEVVPPDVEETIPPTGGGSGTDNVLDYYYYDDEGEYDGDYYYYKDYYYYNDYYNDYYKDYYKDGDYYIGEDWYYDVLGEGMMNNMGTGMRERCKDCKDTVFFATAIKGGHLRSRCRNRCRSRVNREGYSFKILNKCPRLCDLVYRTKPNGMFIKNPCKEVGFC